MAILNIRNLPEEVHARLRIRAAKAGRSMEAEAREIITAVVNQEDDTLSAVALQNWVDQLYGPQKPAHVVETLIVERRQDADYEANQE